MPGVMSSMKVLHQLLKRPRAGGDVVNEGPASIVKAAAAGKAIANSILSRHSPDVEAAENASVDPVPLLRQRAHREAARGST
jgi:hypothetical protein